METFAITKEPKPVTVPIKVGKDAAKTVANQFIFEHLPDRFCAGQPRLVVFPIRTVWSAPIVLAYPKIDK